MMLPATTCSPPNFFRPRRLDSESRPLRDEPPAFLCAIFCSSVLAVRQFRGLPAPIPDLVGAERHVFVDAAYIILRESGKLRESRDALLVELPFGYRADALDPGQIVLRTFGSRKERCRYRLLWLPCLHRLFCCLGDLALFLSRRCLLLTCILG